MKRHDWVGEASPYADRDVKDALIGHLHKLAHAAGWPGFKREFFEDPDVVREWPDLADREVALRAAWREFAAQDFTSFLNAHQGESVATLTG